MLTLQDKIRQFFASPEFAVVGASASPSSWSYKLLLWYEAKKLKVHAVNPNHEVVDGIPCLTCIASLPSPSTTSLSILTEPSITLVILKQALVVKSPMIWIQPGAEDAAVLDFIKANGLEDKTIHSVPQTSAIHPMAAPPTATFLALDTSAQGLPNLTPTSVPNASIPQPAPDTNGGGPCDFFLQDQVMETATSNSTKPALSLNTKIPVAGTPTTALSPIAMPCIFKLAGAAMTNMRRMSLN